MPITPLYTFSAQTIGTTEVDLTSNTTTVQARTGAGYYDIKLDCANVTLADRFRLRVYCRAAAGATQRELHRVDFSGPVAPAILQVPTLLLAEGWTYTLQRLATTSGANRAFTWTIYAVT